MTRRWFEVPTIRAAVLVFVLAGPLGWFLFFALFSRAPAQDLMVFHTAGRLVFEHNLPLLNNGQAFTDLLNRTHADWLRAPLVLHPWVYPPPTLLLAAAIGVLPFGAAYAVFTASGLAVFIVSLWRWWSGIPARWVLLALVVLCPATAFCVGAGQLTFFIAAIFLTSIRWLPVRQVAAGCLLGLLFSKPQFALMVPVALLAGRYWRAIAGAACSVSLQVLVSLVAFGPQPWRDWLHLMLGGDPAFAAWMETGRHFGQSVDTCVRLLGGSPSVASAAQITAIALAAVCVWRVFSHPYRPAQQGIVLLSAAVLAAPHVGNYDALLLGIASVTALGEGIERRYRSGEALLAMAAWLESLINPPALIALAGVPVLTALSLGTPLVTAGLMLSALRR